VGKYVVGPTPKASSAAAPTGSDVMIDSKAIGHSIAESAPGGGCETPGSQFPEGGAGASTQALNMLTVPDIGSDGDKDDMTPKPPPSTPSDGERIWWSNEFFVIKKSALAGLGAFAAKDLEYGDKILVEKPLLKVNNWQLVNEYENMSDEDKELLHSLHKFSMNANAHELEKIRRANS
jgi:hypothetical protein